MQTIIEENRVKFSRFHYEYLFSGNQYLGHEQSFQTGAQHLEECVCVWGGGWQSWQQMSFLLFIIGVQSLQSGEGHSLAALASRLFPCEGKAWKAISQIEISKGLPNCSVEQAL